MTAWNTRRVRPSGERLTAGRVICAATLSLVAALALPGCGSPDQAAPAVSHATPSPAFWKFTVTGDHPVPPNGSQDTYTATPGTACDSTERTQDASVGRKVADGFTLAGFPTAAALLGHFLTGAGTAVGYRAGSSISKQALASSAFRAISTQIQGEIIQQLNAGKTQIRLSSAQLPTVAFDSTASDLYWAFRGTQGLTVTGAGTRKNGRYVGTLSYVIRDSYGFPSDDTLGGFGPPMRYLQTVCGAPQHAGGAHWFPDAIAVTVPLDQPDQS
jgi:hypothetical protein